MYADPESKDAKLELYYTVAEKVATKKAWYWKEQVYFNNRYKEWKPHIIELITECVYVKRPPRETFHRKASLSSGSAEGAFY